MSGDIQVQGDALLVAAQKYKDAKSALDKIMEDAPEQRSKRIGSTLRASALGAFTGLAISTVPMHFFVSSHCGSQGEGAFSPCSMEVIDGVYSSETYEDPYAAALLIFPFLNLFGLIFGTAAGAACSVSSRSRAKMNLAKQELEEVILERKIELVVSSLDQQP